MVGTMVSTKKKNRMSGSNSYIRKGIQEGAEVDVVGGEGHQKGLTPVTWKPTVVLSM